MIIYKTYSYRIYPTVIQKEKIDNNISSCRFVYNKFLKLRKDIYYNYKEYANTCYLNGLNMDQDEISRIDIMPTMHEFKEKYNFLKEADSIALDCERLNINEAFMKFHRHECSFPKFKTKSKKNKYCTRNINQNIRIENEKIRLPKIGFVKMKYHRNLPLGYAIKCVTVKNDKTGKYYVSIHFEYDHVINCLNNSCNSVGLDFKISNIFVSSDNERLVLPGKLKFYNNKIKYLESRLKYKNKFSNGFKKVVIKIRKLYKKISNITKYILHKASRKLTAKYKYIAIETLSISSMAKSLTHTKQLYSASYYSFSKMLIYKMNDLGNVLVKVSKYFASSKFCSKCGNKKDELKLSDKEYTCNICNNVMDRDLNAAINIRDMGIWMLNSYKNEDVLSNIL